jgi:hypothetical protein
VSETQLRRWLTQPAFRDELQAASKEAIDAAILRLAGLTGQAVDTLKEIMLDTQASPGTRLQAVNIHLGRLMDLREFQTFDERLKALERAAGL